MDFGPVDYAAIIPPPSYRCSKCARHGCKLWREYQTFADHTLLLCCDCAGRAERIKLTDIDAEGYRVGKYGRTDQIGWFVPAVPTVEGDTFWGYTSVPPEGCEWWRRLPTRVAGGPDARV